MTAATAIAPTTAETRVKDSRSVHFAIVVAFLFAGGLRVEPVRAGLSGRGGYRILSGRGPKPVTVS